METLVDDYTKGDRVVSLIAHESVKIGDVGEVIGRCTNPDADNAERRVRVQFSSAAWNMTVGTQVTHAPLVDDYAKGDRVVSLIAHASVKIGDVVEVIGQVSNS